MREIKFRAWSNKYNHMFRVKEISQDRNGYLHGVVDTETEDEFQPSQEEYKNHPYVWIGRVDFVKSSTGRTSGLFQDPNDEPFILMQYTGLKDKNGKEIYEGDILQVGKEYSGTFNPTYVTFEDGSFRHQISHMHNPVVLNNAKVMVLEVIGNIYENPELLEVSE